MGNKNTEIGTRLKEIREEAEAYRAFRDDDLKLGDEASANRWDRLYEAALIRLRMMEAMTRPLVGRVGNC